jgi:hypothetical protein
VNQPRVPGRELLIAQAELFHHARAEIVDHDVRRGDQSLDRLPAARALHVDREAALVPVQPGERQAHAVNERPPAAAPVAGVGPLDFDHVGAVVGQQLGADRPLIDMAEIDDADAGEGGGGGHDGVDQKPEEDC